MLVGLCKNSRLNSFNKSFPKFKYNESRRNLLNNFRIKDFDHTFYSDKQQIAVQNK